MNNLKTIGKTEDEVRVGNYMVLFGGKDLTDEYFTDKTEFESEYTKTGMLYVDWEHGFDNDKSAPKEDDVLGFVDWKTAKKDEKGLWVERVLSRRNEYMQYLEALIDEGLIGTSSEAVGSKVMKSKDGEIQIWPLKRDALTVTPAEPRMMTQNAITAIKALSEFHPALKALLQDAASIEDEATSDQEGATKKSNNLENDGGNNTMTNQIVMSDEQFEKLINRDAPKVEEPKEDPRVAELTKTVEGLLDKIQNSPKAKDAGYVAPDSEEDHAEVKTFGDFLVAIRQKNDKRLK